LYSKRRAGIAAILIIAATVVACAGKTSQTYVDRVARAKELPNAPYSDILIVAIAERGATAREFEEVLAAELTNMGVKAIGYHRAASRADVKEEVVRQLAAELGSDAIIFVTGSLVGAQREVTGSRTDFQAQVKGGGLVAASMCNLRPICSMSRVKIASTRSSREQNLLKPRPRSSSVRRASSPNGSARTT
jgi:hypothetical protein